MSRIRLARLASAVAVGMVLAGAPSAAASAAGTGTVQGVFSTSAGEPIAGATVTAFSGEGDWLQETTTDPGGTFRLAGVAAGGVKLFFDNGGLQHWAPGVRTQEAATTYPLAAGTTLVVDESQPATGTIAGHFTDAAGQPASAAVEAHGVENDSSYRYGATDENGAYAIEVLPGTYKVNFRWDTAQQWAVQATTEDAGADITVTAGETTTVDDHKLPTGTAGGRLTNTDGSPLASAAVVLHQGSERLGGATTDENGTYTFGEVLAAGGYTVSYSLNGGTELYVAGTADPAKARTFTVTAGQNTTIDDVRPEPATVHGRLADPDGTPKAGYQVLVTLNSEGNEIQLSATTGDDGTWSVPEVYAGDYKVSFAAPGNGRIQWAYGKSSEAAATLIPVTAGADVTVDDTWLPGATLVVDAVDATTGAPVNGYCVFVDAPGDGTGCAPATGNRVTLHDLPGGTFPVQATPGEGSYYLPSAVEPVTLTSGGTTTITIKLPLGGKVSFTAGDHATGAAVAGVCGIFRVLGHGGLPDGGGSCTGGTGRATSETLAVGTYELFAVPPDGSYGDQWVGRTGGTGDQRAAARIAVKPGSTVKAPAIRLDPHGTITGVVSTSAGVPLGGVNVAFSAWGDAGPAWGTYTDAQGRYTIDDLGPYAWPLVFSGTGFPRQWSGHTGNRFQADPIGVVAGGSSTYNFTPDAGSTLKGTVTAPVADWRIHAVNAATGDDMGTFDSTGRAGSAYSMPLIGGQQVKINWSFNDGADRSGWYDHAATIEAATKVGIPAKGTKTLNFTIG